MDPKKRTRLEARGIRVTDSPAEILGLSDAEMRDIDRRIELGDRVRDLRQKLEVSQADLAGLVGTKQPAIALLEQGSPKVSYERYFAAIDALGEYIDFKFTKKKAV